MNSKHIISILLLLMFVSRSTNANITLPNILSSNMVLQRNAQVPIWGSAAAGEKITVSFGAQRLETIAGAEGKWTVMLKPMKQNAQPAEMIVSGKNTIILTNILVGDVWLCSGQSNMEYPLDYRLNKYTAPAKGTDMALEEISKPKPDKIRFIFAEKHKGTNDIQSVGWITSENDSVLRKVTAAGYFFAKEVFEQTHIPIGIISSSWGGTMIEEWTPARVYENSPVFANQISPSDKKINGRVAGTKFESMIMPIVPFALKGMLWYQGETNCMSEDQDLYPEKVKLMLSTYRALFNNPQMPFYFVQIAPYVYTKRSNDKVTHTPELLPEFWEAQTKCLKIPRTGMVVTTDLVDKLSDIHPSYKWEVGHRLALLALANDYTKKVVSEGPKHKNMKVKGNKVELLFFGSKSELISNDGQSLTWFEIAGSDGKYVEAKAEIKGKKVIVWADEVQKPVNVRFAWNERAMPNLANKAGLPAIPFRTGK